MEKIEVLIAESGEIFREGVAKVLGGVPNINVVAVATTGFDTIQKAIDTKPDIILLDEEIRDCGFIEVSQRIKKLITETRIIVLSYPFKHSEPSYIFKAEANAYGEKDCGIAILLTMIDVVHKGGVCICPTLAARLLNEYPSLQKAKEAQQPWDYDLSKREVEVLDLVAKGISNKEIANALFISENTVKAHLRGILEKLQVRNRQQAAILAREKSILPKAGS